MENENIFNLSESEVEITLTGDFGSDMFSSGITKEEIKNVITENADKNLNVYLSSLGGDLDTALFLYDLVKLHKNKTVVNLLGRNASASTVFAMAFDEVNISDAGLFLVHNVWGAAVGGADKFRKIADDYDKHDDVITTIFSKRTKQTKPTVKKLMNENKWISAKEAKDFGFVNNIIKPKKELQNYETNIIYNKYLPKMKNEMENQELIIKDEATFIDKITDKLSGLFVAKENDTADLQNKVTELETKINTDTKNFESEKNALKTELENLKTEIENLKTENSEMKSKLVPVTNPKKEQDNPENELSGEAKKWAGIISAMKNKKR